MVSYRDSKSEIAEVSPPDSRLAANRPVIMVFLRGYLPGFRFGGPLQSIVNLVDRLGDEFDFRIVTADRDLGSVAPYPGIPRRQWVDVGKARVLYLHPDDRGFAGVVRILRETPHDAVYINSFFDPAFSILPLLAMKFIRAKYPSRVVLAPRGEFSSGALQIRRAKKCAFIAFSRLSGFHRGVMWQASTDREADDIRRTLGRRDIYCATDLPRCPEPLSDRQDRSVKDPLRIVFLSRISPMKNLLFALNVLEKVSSDVVFTIHGPREEEEYWQQCAAAIAALPSNITVVDGGPVEPVDVVRTLAKHDVFFLPTQGENFGHVIGEALEAGLRILVSDRTPWRDLEVADVGHDLPLEDPSAFVSAIESFAARTDRIQSAQKSYAFLSKIFDIDDTVEANRRLLTVAVSNMPA